MPRLQIRRSFRRPDRTWWLAVPLLGVLGIALLWGSSDGVEAAEHHPRRAILDALWMVESSGREQPPDGDGGAAIGPYQIHRIYWQDAIDHAPELGGSYQHCRRRDYAERVIAAYMERWVPAAWEAGHAEVIARVHNGGPTGMDKAATLGYWHRVRAQLRERTED